MGERFWERRPPEISETKKSPEALRSIPPESDKDLRTKEVFSSITGDVKTMAEQDMASLNKLLRELKEKELSFSNFVSPENMLGLSTWVRDDKNTFSSDRLETVESVVETANLRMKGLVRLEWLLKSGMRLEGIRKDVLVWGFLSSPEGKLLEWVTNGTKDMKLLEAEYYLEKAREVRDKIIRGDEIAQDWYDRLKGTPLEAVAEKEKMDLWDRSLRKWREFANSMLGLDSLTALVAGAGIGRAAGYIISKSDKLRNLSLAKSTVLNESIAAKFVVPWVNALEAKAWDSALRAFSKWWANFLAEIAKGFTYTEAARLVWGEKMAHAMSYPLMFIPGLKGQFESSLKVSLAENPANFAKFTEWVTARYQTPEKLEEAIKLGMKESYNRSKSSVGIEEMRKLYMEVGVAVRMLFENVKRTGSSLRNTIAGQAGVKSSVAEGVGSTVSQVGRLKPKANSTTQALWDEAKLPESNPTQLADSHTVDTQKPANETPVEVSNVQDSVRTKVSEIVPNPEPQMEELLSAWLPPNYVVAIQELGISNSQILKLKWWGLSTPHREEYIRNYLTEFNKIAQTEWRPLMTQDEAHALFGYTTKLFYKTINSKLWNGSWEDLKITQILTSAVSKMPKAAPTQFRWDNFLLDDLLKQQGVLDDFKTGKEIPQETLDQLIWKKITTKGFSSSGDFTTEPFWSEQRTKYQLEIRDSEAHDITGLSFFPNFGHEINWWLKTPQESLFLPWREVQIQRVKQVIKPDGTNLLIVRLRQVSN